jgi:SHS2 domain-containing protein
LSYRFLPHTADVAVALAAPSLPALFVDAAAALADTVTDRLTLATSEVRPVSVAAADLDLLLVDWLSEVLFLFDVHRFLPRTARVAIERGPDGWVAAGELQGETTDAARSPIKVLVKAVTYHQLRVVETDAGWEATVILDI